MEDDVDMELELERQMEREQQLDNIKQVQKLVRNKRHRYTFESYSIIHILNIILQRIRFAE